MNKRILVRNLIMSSISTHLKQTWAMWKEKAGDLSVVPVAQVVAALDLCVPVRHQCLGLANRDVTHCHLSTHDDLS
jgi:hypothetical protein